MDLWPPTIDVASTVDDDEEEDLYIQHFSAETRERAVRSIDRTQPLNLHRTIEILKKLHVIRAQATRIINETDDILAKQALHIVAVSVLIERLLLVRKQLSDVNAEIEPHILHEDADAEF